MDVMRKLTTSILIICMFLRLPQPEAMAADTDDYVISSVTNMDSFLATSDQMDCTGLYTIFSSCYTTQINTVVGNGARAVNLYDTSPNDLSIQYDGSDMLPWNNVSEPPTSGFLIPVLQF